MNLNLCLPELLFMRVDKMSVVVDLKARATYRDQGALEVALSIPEPANTAKRELKVVLRRIVRGLIANVAIEQPSQGFSVLLSERPLDHIGDCARGQQSRSCCASRMLDEAEVPRLLATRNGQRVFVLPNLALWWRRGFGDGRGFGGEPVSR